MSSKTKIKEATNLASHVVEEYIRLHSIKNQNSFIKKLEWWVEKSQLKKSKQERYKTHISRAISDQQKAELLHNNPIFDFIPLDGKARKNVYPLKESWRYWWKVDELDSKIYDVVSDAADFGSGFLYQWWKVENRNVKYPKYDRTSWDIIFEEKEIEQYFGICSEYIRIEDIYFDWVTIEDSNVAIWRKFWNRRDFIDAHKSNKMYQDVSDEKIKWYDFFIAWNSKLPKIAIGETEDFIIELRYYNKAEDKLVITANGSLVYNNPIPHTHKELPFVKYDNHIYRDRLIQMWNYELMEQTEEYLDKVRRQSIDVTKANIGFSVIEKETDFDPEVTSIWALNFVEVDNPDAFKHFAANIQSGWLTQLQSSWQEDAIVLSWVDYRSQLISSWETATKTASKNASQLKRINMVLKRNSFKFYNRLAKLRLCDLQFIHSIGDVKVPMKWLHQDKDKFIKIQDWYWLFTIKPEQIEWKFNVVLQTESLLGDSTEKEKENTLSFFQIFGNLADDNGKPIMNKVNMVRIAGQQMGVDTDALLEKEVASKSGEDVINSILQENNWLSPDAANPQNNPNFIPPENKSNDSGGVQVIGWWNTNTQ